jgi:hypothetical protein
LSLHFRGVSGWLHVVMYMGRTGCHQVDVF